jgi:hypothetical protein
MRFRLFGLRGQAIPFLGVWARIGHGRDAQLEEARAPAEKLPSTGAP